MRPPWRQPSLSPSQTPIRGGLLRCREVPMDAPDDTLIRSRMGDDDDD